MPAARQAAFDFIDRLGSVASTDEVISTLHAAGRTFGFENFCISGLPSPGEKLDPYVLASGWPDGWMTRYAARSYVHHDPVIRRVRQSTMPFLWREAPFDSEDKPAVRVMGEATEFGLVEGFAVPIFTTHGFQAIVTFGAKQLSLSHDERAGLHLVAIYAHARARALTPGRASGKSRKPRLSVREVECLKWSSEGKSTWEISVILCLSEKTVEQYLARAASKLGAANRVQSVAEALRQSLIF